MNIWLLMDVVLVCMCTATMKMLDAHTQNARFVDDCKKL
jgi:hypothetical protein